MPAHSALITVMERAARKAGSRLRRDFGEVEHLQVSKKGPADFVSKAHMHAERILYDELLNVRPGWGFVLEEGGMIEGEEGKPRWIIDPLNGTTNFLHGIPHFAISIAVQEPSLDGRGWGKITSGLIYEPLNDQTWWAEMDKGAWLGERRLRVSARRDMSEALIATGIPFKGHGDLSEWARIFGAVAPQVAGIRRNGSAALDLAWLAAGRYDGFFEAGLQVWDVAAGILMVREAGGFVTDYTGGDQPIGQGEILASTEALHSKLHRILAKSLL
ncbi:inositol monophosphatase family protein [Parasphingorhabdus sp.]|uniref:inositol monophosphatase family protein n=1 Tax=Parasphingorhabdus sp. TaxID=2709688 RepID=UPI003002B2DB